MAIEDHGRADAASNAISKPSVTRVITDVAYGVTSAAHQALRSATLCERETLRAFTQTNFEATIAQAKDADNRARTEDLPLRGVMLAVKDNIDVSGFATTAGTAALAGHLPRDDAPAVGCLRQAGAVIVGKANMHELAYGATSDNALFGRVRNPFGAHLIAGGSSGGSAAAVAAGLVTAALGTETGCSVRVPAAFCGLVGFRPTTGIYSSDGVVPVSWTRDTIGILVHTVDDATLIDQTLRGASSMNKCDTIPDRLRLAAPRHPFRQGLTPQLRDLFDQRLSELDRAGITIVDCELPDGLHDAAAHGLTVAMYETPIGIDRYLAHEGATLRFEDIVAQVRSPDVAHLLQPLAAKPVAEDSYLEAFSTHLATLDREMASFLSTYGVSGLIVPTAPLLAPRLLEGSQLMVDGKRVDAFAHLVRNCDLSSVLSWPAITLPAARADNGGLPFGIDLQFPRGRDDLLLSVAQICARAWESSDARTDRATDLVP